MTSNYVIVQTKLWLEVGDDEQGWVMLVAVSWAVLKLWRGVQKPPQTVAGSSRKAGLLR